MFLRGLGPQEIGTSNETYQNLKRDLISDAETFKKQMEDCLELILALD